MKNKYFYNGEPLIDFCKKNPRYRYDMLIKYISIELEKDPSKTIEELVKEFINKKHRNNNKYRINGMSLSKYCEISGLSYTAITKEISRVKRDTRYSNISDNEKVDMVLEKYLLGENIEEIEFTKPKKLTKELKNE